MPIKAMFETALTDTWTVADSAAIGDKLGDVRWEGSKCYKCVQFNNGAGNIASLAGRMAAYYAPGGDHASPNGYASNIVTMDSSDSSDTGAGVFQVVMADLEIGWVQIKGVATMTLAAAAGADGDPMTLVGATDDGGNLDVNTGVTDHICAFADDISADIFILDCPF